jgi:pimeloyl-ACP methyl ester carboxylesterase
MTTARRAALIVATAVIGVPLAGALYQTISVRREARRFPPPGTLIDVGGRRLHVICEGAGRPTVIFESSGLGNSTSSAAVRAEIRSRARTCAYDRVGMGWSDPGPRNLSAGVLADDLERLLDRAALGPPYVLVPASIGGFTSELFARRHADRVAGLVFVDAADSGMAEDAAPKLDALANQVRLLCLAGPAARLGVLRLLDPLQLRRQSSEAAAQTIALTYRAEPLDTVCSMLRGMQKSLDELQAAPPLAPDVPLVVLSHERPEGFLPAPYDAELAPLEPVWRELQQKLARRSTRGTWRVVPNSGHLIAASQPHAVAAAIVEILDLVAEHGGVDRGRHD